MRALLSALVFFALVGAAHAGSIPPINPAQCSLPAACNDLNNYVVPQVNGVQCTSAGVTPQTCNGTRGLASTGTLTTAAATNAAYVINNSYVTASTPVSCDINGYAGTLVTDGIPIIATCVPGAGTITANITNVGANAMNGAVVISFTVNQN